MLGSPMSANLIVVCRHASPARPSESSNPKLILSMSQGTKLTFVARSRLAPKFSKVVAEAKKLGAIKKKR